MVRLYSIPALLHATMFYAKLGEWEYCRYYLSIIPYRLKEFIDHPYRIRIHLEWWIEDIVDFYRRNKKLTWNP